MVSKTGDLLASSLRPGFLHSRKVKPHAQTASLGCRSDSGHGIDPCRLSRGDHEGVACHQYRDRGSVESDIDFSSDYRDIFCARYPDLSMGNILLLRRGNTNMGSCPLFLNLKLHDGWSTAFIFAGVSRIYGHLYRNEETQAGYTKER